MDSTARYRIEPRLKIALDFTTRCRTEPRLKIALDSIARYRTEPRLKIALDSTARYRTEPRLKIALDSTARYTTEVIWVLLLGIKQYLDYIKPFILLLSSEGKNKLLIFSILQLFRYLLLSDIDRNLLYVLSVEFPSESLNEDASVVSVSEFPTPAPLLSFCCISAGKKQVQ